MNATKPNINTPAAPLQCAEQRPSAWRVYANGEKPAVFGDMAPAVSLDAQTHGRIVPMAEVAQ